MRIHFAGNRKGLAPHLLGALAERLEALNTPDEDIFEARVTVGLSGRRRHRPEAIRVELMLAGQTLCVTFRGETPQDTVDAVLHETACQLQTFRARWRHTRQSSPGI